MYFINCSINHFRFNAKHHDKPVNITLYKLEKDGEQVKASCLTNEEELRLTQYLVTNVTNFEGPKNVHLCRASNVPVIYQDPDQFERSFPLFIMIKKNPNIVNYPKKISECMEIELLDVKGKPNHIYNLEFELIGEVESSI